MQQARQELLAALVQALEETLPGHGLTAAFERPRQAAHGDLAITAALPLAKLSKRAPREIAQQLVAALQKVPAVQRWVSALEIAGPGIINLRLAPAAKQAVVADVMSTGAAYGVRPAHGQRVMVEFGSANPTGPLHLGHARQAALGDALCNLFVTQGWQVTREFYYNDAGVQIARLAQSVKLRIDGLATRVNSRLGYDIGKKPRTYTVWVSDDADRVPLKVVARTELGNLEVELVHYERPSRRLIARGR